MIKPKLQLRASNTNKNSREIFSKRTQTLSSPLNKIQLRSSLFFVRTQIVLEDRATFSAPSFLSLTVPSPNTYVMGKVKNDPSEVYIRNYFHLKHLYD